MLIGSSTGIGIQRQMGSISSGLRKNFERLSSGRRINRASDDAAGLAIAERLSAMVSGLSQADRNVADGVSLANVADGAMSSQGDSLIRMRELAVQSANGTLSDSDRQALNSEFNALRDEVDRVSNTTEFNGTPLLQGNSIDMQAGTDGTANSRITIDTADTSAANLNIVGLDIGTQGGAQTSIADIDAAIDQVNSSRGDIGATVNRLDAARNNISTEIENTTASLSRIQDLDVASESSDLANNNVLMRAALATMGHANNMKGMLVSKLL
jgi:flagellin